MSTNAILGMPDLLDAAWPALLGGIISAACAALYAYQVLSIKIDGKRYPKAFTAFMRIQEGSKTFLKSEYSVLSGFSALVFVALLLINWQTALSFVIGAGLSVVTGYLGMSIAVRSNLRTTLACSGENPLGSGLRVAFKSGAVMGLTVVATGILGVTALFLVFSSLYTVHRCWMYMSGFAVGASSIALFARVGGGIYTKAADVGADLAGKIESGLEEDDPNNPATIADNVGDNVGDVAGMGSDLFESYVGCIIAAGALADVFVKSDLVMQYGEYSVLTASALPLWIAGLGAICSVIGTFLVRIQSKFTKPAAPAQGSDELEQFNYEADLRKYNERVVSSLLRSIRTGIYSSSLLVLVSSLIAVHVTFGLGPIGWRLYFCVVTGIVIGNLIGFFTEIATSYTYAPTRSIARKSDTGPATVVIQGLGVGMLSTAPPLIAIVAAILLSGGLAGVYGVAIAGVGMLATLGVSLATDAFGPVCDNAGGIAEMAGNEFDHNVRETTDALDALGNTTAATGKGFAIGSAVLAAVALMAAFATEANLLVSDVPLMHPVVFPGILLGALMPFVFAALTMLSVGRAAESIMLEVRRQIADLNILGGGEADHTTCIKIATNASLWEMLPPGLLAIFVPIITGFLLGARALLGMLVGVIAVGFLMAVKMSNAGGAWDNAKKFVEKGNLNEPGVNRGKRTPNHDAVVVGDTIGDPFKDTSGPALNLLIKLMTVTSLVLAPKFSHDPWVNWQYALIAMVLFAFALAALVWFASRSSKKAAKKRLETQEKALEEEVKVVSEVEFNAISLETVVTQPQPAS